ncbi:MAG: UDP-N-acetylmuramate--L-alanine ligase [Solirubrobacteraceae bacterium]
MSAGREWSGRTLHLIGVGGAGMSGLALVARALGATVSGSDRAETAYLDRLRAAGIEPVIGHDPRNVPAAGEVVVSTAIAQDNPERAAAREHGLRELHRAELLGELTRLRRTIAVTGTHGKTTTSSMVVEVLRGCGMDPSYVVGGDLRSTGVNAAWGGGEWLVVEADESDRSLLRLAPEVAVLTNAELDHHSTYGSLLELRDTFTAFLGAARTAVVWERPELLALVPDGVEAVPYDAPDARPEAGGVAFTWRGREVALRVPGAHNAVNAAGALEAAAAAGADPDAAADSIAAFSGAGRRFEPLGETSSGARVYDDYAHHPTEVTATLDAARSLEPRRVVAVLQPHLYSRTAALHREFGAALAAADLAVVLDVYPSRERAEDHPGVSGLLVAEAAADAAAGGTVAWMPRFADAEPYLARSLREGDVCVVLGAGDVNALGRALVV